MIGNNVKTLLIANSNGVLEIVLNRADKRNALNKEMIADLKAVFRSAARDPSVRVIVLKGAGKAFCSGADLEYMKELKAFDRNKNLKDSLTLAELFLKIYSHPKPVIAVVNGPALAGGCGLATVCDFVLATPDTRFGYPEVKIGFVAAVVSVFLIRQIGERKARELLLSGTIIDAERALQIGLISSVYRKEEITQACIDLTRSLKNNSGHAMSTTKKMIAGFEFEDIESQIKKMAQLNAESRETDDFIEGISAFIEKRKPNWIVD